MRNLLLGTTALAALAGTVSAPAWAAENLSLKVGGYMDQYVGYSNVEDDSATFDTDGVDIQSDTEIWFAGTTTLDNGIEFGVNVQLEGNSTSDQIDESYLFVHGPFGELIIGDENSAMYKMHEAPPQFGAGANDGDFVSFVLSDSTSISDSGFSRGPYGDTALEPARANDSTKITYFSPRIAGLQLGASYSPDTRQDNNTLPDRNSLTYTDGVMVGASVDHSFAGLSVAGSLGYGTFLETSTGTEEPEAFNAGLVLGYDGFSAGVSYARMWDSGVSDGTAWNVGAAYETGPLGVSVTYFHGERDGIAGSTDPDTANADNDTVQLAAEYTLGPGVQVSGTLGYSEFTSDTAGVGDVTGTYFISGIHLKF